MKYAIELEELNKAKEALMQAKFWINRVVTNYEEKPPSHLAPLEEEVDNMIEHTKSVIDSVKSKFAQENGLWLGTYIYSWCWDNPKHYTYQRHFIEGPNHICDAPHINKASWDAWCIRNRSTHFAYDEPFDVYVMNGKRVLFKLKGNGVKNNGAEA